MELLLAFIPIITVLVITLIFKRVIPALFAGILVLLLLHNIPLQQTATYSWEIVSDSNNLQLIGFTILLSFLTSLLTLNGNFEHLINKLKKYVKTKKQALWLSYFSGLIIFFDDYANTIILGNSLKNLCKPYNISKEKLAYIVDSTAAPVASIAIVSTWVGFELTQIETSLKGTQITTSALSLLLQALPYSFYPILTLGFIFLLIYSEKDFGPMKKAEEIASNQTSIPTSTTENLSNSIMKSISPILITLLVTLGYIIYSGYASTNSLNFITTIGDASVNTSILLGSLSGVIVQLFLTKKHNYLPALKNTYSQITEPLIIILLAWLLGTLTKQLHIELLLSPYFEQISPLFIPVSFFVLAAIISFSTGTSFATMSIMFPIVIPIVLVLGIDIEYLYASIAVVLSGAIFGDHCSPISDTTILSSAACDCNHTDHVKTQLPYAITVGIISAICLIITFLFSINPFVGLFIGMVMNWGTIKVLGK